MNERTDIARPITLSRQLEAYADAFIENLSALERSHGAGVELKQQLKDLIQRFQAGELDKLSFFLSIKAIEYRVVSALHFNTRELSWFLKYDLVQTPATAKELCELNTCFLGDEKASPADVDAGLYSKITHVAVGHWQRYAEMLFKAIQREKQISLYLVAALAAYLFLLFIAGLRELLPQGLMAPQWRAFADWFASTKEFHCIAFGGLGAVVSITLAERTFLATRPFDDLYQFWTKVPKLLIGMIAGLLAPHLLGVLGLLITAQPGGFAPTQGNQFLLLLVAFSAGFSDRLFFDKLVKATWKQSGLEVSDKG